MNPASRPLASTGLTWAAALVWLAAGAARADGEAGVVAEARGTIVAAASAEGTAAFIWSITAVAAGGYAGAVFSGHARGAPVLTYVAVAGLAGGLTGLGTSLWRRHELTGLVQRVDGDLAGPAAGLTPPTRGQLGAELRREHGELVRASEGSLRAGCVVPVLLSGIGLYGLLLDEPAGQQLAGVTLGGAMVIGVPSMLTYWGLSGRLERMDGLLQRWSQTESDSSGGAPTR